MASGRSTADRRYQFGPYTLDPRKRVLWRDQTAVPLTSKAFDILLLLVEQRGRVVSKEALLAQGWQGAPAEENTLARHVSTIRKALGERPNDPQYVATVSGNGYQFVADVVVIHERHDLGRPGPAQLEEATGDASGVRSAVDAAAAGDPPNIVWVTAAGTGIAPSRPGARLSFAGVAGVLGLAVLLGAASAGFRVVGRSAAVPIQRQVRQLTFQAGLHQDPTWSPDGRTIAYATDSAGNSEIWVQRLADAQATRLTSSPAEDSQPSWSPDGQRLVFRSERDGGGLFLVPAAGGDATQLTAFGYHPQWSPDGRLILFTSSEYPGGAPKYYCVSPADSTPVLLRPDIMASYRNAEVSWRPEGHAVSIWGRDRTGELAFITAAVDGGDAVRSLISDVVAGTLDSTRASLGRFRWSPSGSALYFEGSAHETRGLWRIEVDPETLAWVAGPDRLTTGTTDDTDVSVSPDGRRVVFAARSAQTLLWMFPFDAAIGRITGSGEPLTSGAGREQEVSTTADGRRLVYRAFRGDRQEFWQREVATGRESLLFSSREGTRSRPQWSPDGTRLAYARHRVDAKGRAVDRSIVILPIGGEEEILQMSDDEAMSPLDWSPDGKWLVGHCPNGPSGLNATCLKRLPDAAGGDGPLQILASDPGRNLFQQRFSPNQQWISFMAIDADDAGASTIYVMPATGGPWRPMTDGTRFDDKPRWSPDGRTIYFVSNREGLLNLWGRRVNPASGEAVGPPFRVTSFSSPSKMVSTERLGMQFALTGDRLFLPVTQSESELWIIEGLEP